MARPPSRSICLVGKRRVMTKCGKTGSPRPTINCTAMTARMSPSYRCRRQQSVFLGASYFSSASRDIAGTQSNPSDVVGLRMGGSLAISPVTSITTGFNVAYLTNPHFTDFVVPNSDRVLSTVDVGFSTIVWTRTLLNVTAQFGITGHVPD